MVSAISASVMIAQGDASKKFLWHSLDEPVRLSFFKIQKSGRTGDEADLLLDGVDLCVTGDRRLCHAWQKAIQGTLLAKTP